MTWNFPDNDYQKFLKELGYNHQQIRGWTAGGFDSAGAERRKRQARVAVGLTPMPISVALL